MSNYLHDDLQEGDLLRSYGPAGTFTVAPIMGETRRHICLVAGGAGIVPLQAIARSLLLEELRSTVTLIYGSAAPLATIFGSDLADLAKAYPERLQLHMVYEDSADGPGARLDAAGLSPILKQMDLAQLDRILLCGPDAMRTSVRQTMIDAGVVDARIEEEVFRTPRPYAMPTTAQTATLIRADGTQVAIQVEPSATLLDACLEAGEAIRFSCMSGTCGTCRVHLLDGLDNAQVDQPLPASDPTDVMPACVLRLIGPVTFKIPGPNI